jgi:RNA polymerase sigma-70 factor (ECF subfamily)
MLLPWSGEDAKLSRLWRWSRGGDREALRELYRALYPRVAGYVGRRCARREDVEDVVSRTFHRLLERLDAYDARRGGVLPFVLSIARNLLLDDARSRHASVLPLDGPEGAQALAALVEPRTPLQLLEQGEELRALRERLDALPATAREVLALRYGEELSHREIAQLLGASEDAIKQRCSRALRELRAAPPEPARKGVLA